ncbi:MAG TPA: choice-of-anchor tandem repeat GloVer-containing protein [Candidatus Cybelea sp.]|nr:choice-of-anchor tandem repeat GloVer-containing protein [Candidatus Cybelea sp.]
MKNIAWFLCALLLAACARPGTTLPPLAAPSERDATPLAAYKMLYRFPGGNSGSGPTGFINVKGVLYGTTLAGGSQSLGTVFVRDTSGKVRVLHSFGSGADGAEPNGTLVDLNGTLYGTTQYGGTNGNGTVFAIDPNGSERVLYSFKGGADGATPLLAGLVIINGKLYGTTNAGGNLSCRHQQVIGCGTVFAITTSGTESVFYKFKGKPDGANPSGPLTASGSTIYGTTNFGGSFNDGSVFSLTTSGAKKTLYSFKGFPDGVEPFAGVTLSGGKLYGTTTLGGAYEGAGTVFELTTTGGKERVLHSFRGAPDGALPYGWLAVAGNTFYGTTEFGGSSRWSCVGHGVVGCGTIFSVTPSGKFTLLYHFKGHVDGAFPLAGLVAANSGFYGTTVSGGTKANGTIFRVTP